MTMAACTPRPRCMIMMVNMVMFLMVCTSRHRCMAMIVDVAMVLMMVCEAWIMGLVFLRLPRNPCCHLCSSMDRVGSYGQYCVLCV